MIYIICFIIAVTILAVTAVRFFRNTENKLLITGAGLFLALFTLFVPFENCSAGADAVNTVLISILRSIRVFGLNEDLLSSEFNFGTLPEWFCAAYVLVLNLLYLLAPLLTFGLVISFFGNLFSGIRLIPSIMKDIYVFSSVNTRSAMLAEDIRKHNSKAVFVFYNAASSALHTRRDVICFTGSITGIRPMLLRYSKHLTLFICDDNEADNLSDTIALLGTINKYPKLVKKLKNIQSENGGIDLYLFTSRKKAEPVLNGIDNCGVRLRKINGTQSLVYNFIYETPLQGYADENNEINIAIVGAGGYGEEFLRAAVWSAQHPDYRININVFDIRNVGSAFSVRYPELVKTETLPDSNEINYSIRFHDNTDIFETPIEDISGMDRISFVLVALGDDEKNFEASVYLRECFERIGAKPEIHTIMSHSDFSGNNGINITNHKKQSYCIDFILPESIYTYDKVMNTELEKMGKKMFSMWSSSKQEEDFSAFYDFEFNYRSSIAASMFWQIRKKLGMSIDVTEENKRLEHRRWNAFMRSEGFRYSEKRNDIAKTHNCLVPFDELDKATQDYDAYPIRSVSEDE